MMLQEILREKGSAVHSITPDSTLEDVVQSLVRHNCGSLVVCEPSECGMRPDECFRLKWLDNVRDGAIAALPRSVRVVSDRGEPCM